MKVCVYCASSSRVPPEYLQTAAELGRLLAANRITIVYGGGASGLMGALANASLAAGGHVVGVIPEFMMEREWGHAGLPELYVVKDIHERKRRMIRDVSAVVALPGGSGTLEELLEAITWRRLELYCNPVLLLNTHGYYDPLVALLDRSVREGFMNEEDRVWTVLKRPEDVIREVMQSGPSLAE